MVVEFNAPPAKLSVEFVSRYVVTLVLFVTLKRHFYLFKVLFG